LFIYCLYIVYSFVPENSNQERVGVNIVCTTGIPETTDMTRGVNFSTYGISVENAKEFVKKFPQMPCSAFIELSVNK
jgi:hypothetical protein